MNDCDKAFMVTKLKDVISRLEANNSSTDEILRIKHFLISQIASEQKDPDITNALFLGFYIQLIRNNLETR